jgi:hypothetical protein
MRDSLVDRPASHSQSYHGRKIDNVRREGRRGWKEGRPGLGESECLAIQQQQNEEVGLPTVSTVLSGGSPLNLRLRFS